MFRQSSVDSSHLEYIATYDNVSRLSEPRVDRPGVTRKRMSISGVESSLETDPATKQNLCTKDLFSNVTLRLIKLFH